MNWGNVRGLSFAEFWKRQARALVVLWKCEKVHRKDYKRPEWYGTDIRKSRVTGNNELYFKKSHKIIIRSITAGLMTFSVTVLKKLTIIRY
jgi:hypothetical protein